MKKDESGALKRAQEKYEASGKRPTVVYSMRLSREVISRFERMKEDCKATANEIMEEFLRDD